MPAKAPTAIAVPKGYREAWADDRLNPNRGSATAQGQAQQDLVWTRDVPAKLVTNTTKRKVYVTSASNAPRQAKVGQAKRATGNYFVQVGTFGEAANATRTAARLQGLGLPVAKSRIISKGRQLQIVMAGPFGDANAASAALSAARRSGFGDAFIR
jgi:cell division protein FtsN